MLGTHGRPRWKLSGSDDAAGDDGKSLHYDSSQWWTSQASSAASA